ncbi:XdhC family protein [Kribbella sp. NPDC050241]|uniref:XdhC family protein n=1 Tax=Kribbella sp. NPDC050241 TaxID=3364115 RepID=UPI0037911F31
MQEVVQDLAQWWREDRTVGMATVVAAYRSAPRPPGASLLVGPDGEVVGSVSGGCVEGAVYEAACEVASSGRPTIERYGVSDDDAFAVGLTCGGTLEIFVEAVSRKTFPELGSIAEDIESGRPVAVATVIECADPELVGRRLVVRPESAAGSLGSAQLDAVLTADVRGVLAAGRTCVLSYGPQGQRTGHGLRVFVSTAAPPPRLIVFGAIDFAAALTQVGSFLGYRVTVCDARALFATARRFPFADDVVVDWPHRYLTGEAVAGRIDGRTAIAVLTHDPKFDVPLLEVALRLPEVGYLGAMGSRRTHSDRTQRLREAGVTEAELARLSSPIGLDLGARTPQETAISIVAEIIAGSQGGSGRRLGAQDGPIHRLPIA